MTLEDLITLYRERADDAGGFVLSADEVLARHATEAEQEAAVRARLLYDDTTADLTRFALTASQHTIELDPLVFAIDSARFVPTAGGRGRELEPKGVDWMHEQCDWAGRSSSRPRAIVHFERYRARIWETPSVAGELQLGVYRLPLSELEDPDDEPEIAIEHHRNLVDWMLHRTYGNKDSEQYDPQRSADALARFEANFGTRHSADVMRRHRERRRITTRCI